MINEALAQFLDALEEANATPDQVMEISRKLKIFAAELEKQKEGQ